MRNIVYIGCLLMLLVTSCDSDKINIKPKLSLEESEVQALDNILTTSVASNELIPGATALVARDGEVLWQNSVGLSDVSTSTAVHDESQFIIASITKTFVATVALQLMEEGTLDLADPIAQYLHQHIADSIALLNGVNYISEITVQHLLNHTSGIYDYIDADFVGHVLSDPSQRYSSIELVQYAMRNGELENAPGTYHYSNTNYILLDLILSDITGKPLKQLLEERIFNPLQLNSTYFKPNESDIEYLMTGYYGPIDATAVVYGAEWGLADGGIVSNTTDVAKFGYHLFSGKLFQQSNTLDLMLNFHAQNYGLGIELFDNDANNGMTYGHAGASGGYHSYMTYNTKTGYLIVAGMNQSGSNVNAFPTIESMYQALME